MDDPADDPRLRLAEAVRAACEQAALQAFEQASVSGLCCEGAWEVAIGAIHSLDLHTVIEVSAEGHPSPED